MEASFRIREMGVEVFLLADGEALVLLDGATHATVSALEWRGCAPDRRIHLLHYLAQSLRRAEAHRRAEEDPRIGILHGALLAIRNDAITLLGMLAFKPGGEEARRIFERFETAFAEIRKIERGR